MKLSRHAAILRLVRAQRLSNQEALRQALRDEGMDVAQATLSRDIRDLGLVKQADPSGGSFYIAPVEGPSRPDVGEVLANWVVGTEAVGVQLVIRTHPGGAVAVAELLEQAGWSEVVGAFPGPRGVLVVTRSEAERRALEKRLAQAERAGASGP